LIELCVYNRGDFLNGHSRRKFQMAKTPTAKKRTAPKKKIANSVSEQKTTNTRQKNAFEENFGEGTAFDLDYGKLLIIALCIYIAVQVS